MRLRSLLNGFVLLGEFIGLWLLEKLCGYGERPLRVFWWFIGLIIGFTIIYFFSGGLQSKDVWYCLYYSFISSTALGYGSWIHEPVGWAKALGALESTFGIFLMGLFVATFTRWATR